MKKLQPFLPHLLYILIIWLIPLIVYLRTVSPSILYIDAGTMIAAASKLGIPNPPGFPTYITVAHLFTKIPIGTILFRMQLFSIISALGVLTLVYLLVQKTSKIAGLTAALILAFSYQFWSQAINSESYIFTNFLMTLLVYLAVTLPEGSKKISKRLIFGGLLLGIATGANPTIVQVIPALLIAGIFNFRKLAVKGIVGGVLAAVLATVLVYSYLPIRATQYPFLNWGNPQTAELFIGHLKGDGLNINDPSTSSINGFTGSLSVFSQSVGRYIYLLFLQFTPLLLPLIVLGLYDLYQRNRRFFFILISIPLTNLIFGGLYLSGNQESWFIASYVVFAVCLGMGINSLLKVIPVLKQIDKRYINCLPLVLALFSLIWWFPKLDRSNQVVTGEYANNLYSNLGKGAVVIGSGDFFNSMANYEHEVIRSRPDVFPIVANMWYILPWYRDNLRHQRPDLMPKELESMIKKDRFEEYNEVMNWYIKWLIDRGHPVYVTPMVFRETVLAGTDAGKYVPNTKMFKAVNNGLTYRMLTADDLLQPSEDSFKYQFKDPQFYKNTPFYLERNYKAGYHLLLKEYGISFADMADYLLNNTKQAPELKQKALEYIQKAYEFAPFSGEVVNRMAIFAAFSQDLPGAIKYFKEAAQLEPNSLEVRLNLAKALLADKQESDAIKQLQLITQANAPQQIKDEAQAELSKITAQNLASSMPKDWVVLQPLGQNFELKYPKDWQVKTGNGVSTLSVTGEEYKIQILGGILRKGETAEEWVKKSPIIFSGQKSNQGLAQLPPFEATAAFWTEGQVKTLEFVLVKDQHILHLKVKPADSKLMSVFDQIISGIKLLD